MIMPSILILTRKTESAKIMKSFLHAHNLQNIYVIQDVAEARHYLSSKAVDIVLLDTPFTLDQHELSFALSIIEQKHIFLIVLVKKEQYASVCEKVEAFGIFTLQKPIIKDVFTQVLSFANASFHRNQRYQEKNEKLLDKIKEIKLVDRAKCLLIEHAFMSESDAHKYIEKQAMDHRVRRGEIARAVIEKYVEE